MSVKVARGLLVAMALLGASACTTEPRWWPATPSNEPMIEPPLRTGSGAPIEGSAARALPAAPAGLQVTPTPALPPQRAQTATRPTLGRLPEEPADLSVNFDQLTLPAFVQVVFGNMLKLNFQIDPQVAQRQDLVTFRTGRPQSPAQLFDAARMVLKTYGVAVIDAGGFYRIVPDSAAAGYSPEIRRGRALPDTPAPLRPVFQLLEPSAVRLAELLPWLRAIFGNRVQMIDDQARNTLLVSGPPDDVAALIDAFSILDQPPMRGRVSVRLTPVLWSAEEFARRLTEVLAAQGYSASTGVQVPFPITLLPIAAVNAVLVFASDQSILDHVVRWARELDKPGSGGRGAGYFTYQVRYADAQELARTLNDLIAGAGQQAAPAQGAATAPRRARVVVNSPTNSLIFHGSADEYTQWMGLLQELDRPSRTVLIEATVAEVRLTDSESLGIEWAFSHSLSGVGNVSGGTLGGLGLDTTAGLVIRYLNPTASLRAVLSALATNNRAKILSSPRLVARNGEQAMIQVGQEVPIVTSVQSNAVTTVPGTILQTIQYRSTGVVLRVRPVIHSGGRVELDVSQEVSVAQNTTTGVNNTPTFITRKVESKLSLADGATVLLGGLIAQNDAAGVSGVPLVKNIPFLGQLFRTNTANTERIELIVLLTPYVINSDYEARAITDAFRNQLGPWTIPRGGLPPIPESAPAPSPAPSPLPQSPAVPASTAGSVAPSPGQSAAPVVAPDEQSQRAAPAGAREASGSGAAPTTPAAGPPVDDPKLIEELNRAARGSASSVKPAVGAKPAPGSPTAPGSR